MKKIVSILIITLALGMTLTSFDKGGDAIKVYPQPIKTITRVTSEAPIQRIEVYTLLGTLVLDREGEGELDFSAQPEGYYMIKVYSGKNIFVKRVEKH